MATFNTDLCNKALKLLRQDIEITGQTGTPIAVKCAALYDIAYDAVASAHDWSVPMTGSVPTDETQKRLLVYSLAKELAIPITGRQADFENAANVYQRSLMEAVRKDIELRIANNDDAILAQIIRNFTGKDEQLPYTYSVYTARKAAIASACEAEVKSVLGLNTLDTLATAAANVLTLSRLAAACGLDANFIQLKDGEYAAKILQWRKLKLDAELATCDDPILLQLIGNFKGDDQGLVNAFDVYEKKSDAVRSESEREVRSAFSAWENETITTNPTITAETITFNRAIVENSVFKLQYTHGRYWYPAYESLVKSKLAAAMGLDANFVQLYQNEYKIKLQHAIRLELDALLSANTDPILAALVGNFREDDPGLPNAWTIYSARVTAVKTQSEATVRDVLGIAAGTTLSGAAAEAAVSLSVAKLAPACGLDANIVNLKMAEYDKLITEYRKNKLEADVTGHTGLYTAALDEVKKTLGITGNTVDDLAESCAEILTRAHNGEKAGYDANYVQTKLAEYQAKIIQWRKVALDTALAANTDGILAQLVANFNGDDQGLINAWTVYTKRVDAIKTQSEATVRDVLGIAAGTTLSGAAAEAAVSLSVAKLAPACGLDANIVNLKMAEYDKLIMVYRKNRLDEALKTENDPILSMVLGNFRGDDSSLVNAYDVYTKRKTVAEDGAVAELNNEHEWSTAFAKTLTTHPAYMAYTYLVALKVASACGASVEAIQVIAGQYKHALNAARIKDLETACAAETDRDLLEAIALVKQYVTDDGRIPWGWATLKRKYALIKDAARKYVLDYHGWSFCKKIVNTSSTQEADGICRTRKPTDAERILECRGETEILATFTTEGDIIYTSEPVKKISYVVDYSDFTDWPTMLKKAYISRLAEEIAFAMPTADTASKSQALAARTEKMLMDLRQQDTRQNRANYTEAVSHNRYTASHIGEGRTRKW